MNRTREITEASLFSAILAIFIIGGFFIPVLGNVFILLLPLPMLILALKQKTANVIISAVAAGIVSGMFVTMLYGVMLALLSVFVGLPIGYGIKKKMRPLLTIGLAGVGALIATLLLFQIAQWMTGLSFVDELELMFDAAKGAQQGFNTMASNLGVDASQEELDRAFKLLDDMKHMMLMIIPSMLLMFGMMYAAVNYVVGHKVAKRLKLHELSIGVFSEFTYPKHMAYGAAGMILMATIVGSLGWIDPDLVTSNFMYIFVVVFSIQGFALASFYLKPRIGRGGSVALVLVLTLFLGMQYFAVMGYLDVLIQFRKRMRS